MIFTCWEMAHIYVRTDERLEKAQSSYLRQVLTVIINHRFAN